MQLRPWLAVGLLISTVSACPVRADAVRVTNQGMKLQVRTSGTMQGHQWGSQDFILNNGLVRYGLSYHAYVDKAFGDKVKPSPEGYLGLPLPSGCNWYSGGFLAIRLNGSDLGVWRPAAIRTVEQGERGMGEVLWLRPEAQVRFRFMLEPGSDYLACEVAVNPLQPLKSCSLSFRCFPSFFTSWNKRAGHRQVIGPVTTVEQGQSVSLSPVKDNWLLYQDTVFDYAKNDKDSAGPCALLYLPDQVQGVRLAVSDYPVTTELTIKPQALRGRFAVRFAVWEFPKETNAAALQRMRTGAAAVAAHLRTLDFSDQTVADFDMAHERADLDSMLAHASQAAKWRRTLSPLLDHIGEVLAALKQGDMAQEQQAAALIAQYRDKIWDLRFDALLSD